MRKYLLAAGLAAALAIPSVAPAVADASTYCPMGATDYTRGGWVVTYRGATGHGMNCSSVRYAMGEFRAKIRRQGNYPKIARPFFDGWVTWYCYKTSGHGVSCYENTSDTSFTFRAWIR